MTDLEWHAPAELLARFAAEPASIDDAVASSVEAHLVACGQCRSQMSAASEQTVLDASWASIVDRIDQRPLPILERFLTRLGFEPGYARLLAATPGLRVAGLAAVAVLAAAAAAASNITEAQGTFLLLAPLAPLAAVAASFLPANDPGGEAGIATPWHGAGLVVRRAVAVLGVTFVLVALCSLALPQLGPLAAAWLLPALALSLGALALSTWVRLELAIALLGGGWVCAVCSIWWLADQEVALADSTAFGPAGQWTALAISFLAVAIIAARRDRFSTMEVF